MKNLITIFLFLILSSNNLFSQIKVNWKKVHILVYSKNGKGYVHDNIPFAVACMQRLGNQQGFKVDTSSNPSVFTKENLAKYTLLVFTSTNNDVFDNDEQRLAFRHYIEAGGGLVGIHSAIATERNWTWFKQLTGGTFVWHAAFQKYTVRIIDKSHPSVAGLPTEWVREDECYFEKELYPGIHTFMVQDVTTLKPDDRIQQHKGSFGDYFPAAWHHNFDGGLAWMTTLGHDKNDYSEPVFVQHLLQGIAYVATHKAKKLNYSKAYAKNRNEPIKW